jgi:very-short-patch-repair endonuclease
MDAEHLRVARDRLLRIFQFLKALHLHRNPAVRMLRDQRWHYWLADLPDHPAVEFTYGSDEGEWLLRVRRPNSIPPPAPPADLTEWLEDGWRDPSREVEVRPELSRGERAERFDGDPVRPDALRQWLADRRAWASAERPARAALRLFEDLYGLYGTIERESEAVELVVGDGLLSWRRPEGGIFHPVLLQVAQLRFEPEVPRFAVELTGRPIELYSEVFPQEVDGRAIAKCEEELRAGEAALGDDGTDAFLNRLAAVLSPRGVFRREGRPEHETEHPTLGRVPCLFLRARNQGLARMIQGILEDVEAREDPPAHLLAVAGLPGGPQPDQAGSISDRDLWLTKRSNPEQERIARRAGAAAGVLVQGPPGTGKTYAIGNLVGHFLAQGQSVLVTSHATKALRMVRSQVSEKLRPLCASLLDSDIESRRELEASVGAITARLTQTDASALGAEARRLAAERERVMQELAAVREQLVRARSDEYRPVVVAGEGITPSDAARQVAAGQSADGWIPGPLSAGSAMPISEVAVAELYETNALCSTEDERLAAGPLPPPSDLPAPELFSREAREERTLVRDRPVNGEFWAESACEDEGGEAPLREAERELSEAARALSTPHHWRREALRAGMEGDQPQRVWLDLADEVESAVKELDLAQPWLMRHRVELDAGSFPDGAAERAARELLARVVARGTVGRIALWRRRSRRRLLRAARVDGGRAATKGHYEAIYRHCRVEALRRALRARWDRQMVPAGAPSSRDLGAEPERRMRAFCAELREALGWYTHRWPAVEGQLLAVGLRWEVVLAGQRETCPLPLDALLAAAEAARAEVAARADLLRSRGLECRRLRLSEDIDRLQAEFRRVAGADSSIMAELRAAVVRGDPERYRRAWAELERPRAVAPVVARRAALLASLQRSAPLWAAAVRRREGPHGRAAPPGAPEAAWRWRQLYEELERRASADVQGMQAAAERLAEEQYRLTAELVDRRAWLGQLGRVTGSQRQALIGWLDTIKRIGRGTGTRAPRLRAEAAALMAECQGAVPVWVMPLSRVAQNFDPRRARFDVVIIDEASQADVLALSALYLGRRVIVVGDHEQISPAAVGQQMETIDGLVARFLQGIPNSHLYDGKTSVYDLARQSFGDSVRLVEHFRCATDIIQFSNDLCYQGEIKPLRDTTPVRTLPHATAYRVEGGCRDGKTNPQEALACASLVAAALEQAEYQTNDRGEPVSFGVVSLLGQDQQAQEIARLLREHLPPEVHQRHRILCGNAAQFQGDERDVVFLSMVDAPQGGPLVRNRETQEWKQRFNVAASRARDQMWVVHSLDPRVDLQPGDLRRRLIEHGENPAVLVEALAGEERKTESEFERQVLSRLVRAGYDVTAQWPVGARRIDLVVKDDAGRRLAVECDGDRYHNLDNLDADLERQGQLERLGWTFVRVRSSVFFREPERAMRPVLARLGELGIRPRVAGAAVPPSGAGLRARVVRRAQELRAEWESAAEAAAVPSAGLPGGSPGAAAAQAAR